MYDSIQEMYGNYEGADVQIKIEEAKNSAIAEIWSKMLKLMELKEEIRGDLEEFCKQKDSLKQIIVSDIRIS